MESHRAIVFDVFEKSGYNNLRSLNQAILEFSPILNLLSSEALERSGLTGKIIKDLLMFVLGYRKDILKGEDLIEIGPRSFTQRMDQTNKSSTKDIILEIEMKCGDNVFNSLWPSDKCWAYFVQNAVMPVQEF